MNRPSPEPGPDTNTAAVLFSGGDGSVLTAIRIAMVFERVALVSFTRKGLRGSGLSPEHSQDLTRFFGGGRRFDENTFPVDRLCRKLAVKRTLGSLSRHGLLVLSPCGLCRLALHWRALVFCLEKGIDRLADGTRYDGDTGPVGDSGMFFQQLQNLYQGFGIELLDPVRDETGEIGGKLARLRYGRASVQDRPTGCDRRCATRILDSVFKKAIIPRTPGENLVKRSSAFCQEKLDLISDWTREWIQERSVSRLGRLLE